MRVMLAPMAHLFANVCEFILYVCTVHIYIITPYIIFIYKSDNKINLWSP